MRLVIEYGSGDGCTFHCTNTIPVEYESAEAFAVDFEAFCREKFLTASWPNGDFMFANQMWDVLDFFEEEQYCSPEIFTVDEWFALR